MRFTVLGPLRAWHDGAELRLGPPKQRLVLALLLAQAGSAVPARQLVDALWAEQEPPASARNVLHRHVGEIRRLLEPELGSRSDAQRLVRVGDGYLLNVRTDELDLLQFRALRAQSKTAAEQSSPAHDSAAALLIEALSLWNGRCGDELPPSLSAHPVFTAVNSEFAAAAKEAADAALAAGCAERVLPVLRGATAAEPYDEALQASLVVVLSAAGRQAEALEHYECVRARLADELGLDPGPTLRSAQQQVLEQSGPPLTTRAPAQPAQLPRDLASFAGRHDELARLQALLSAEESGPGMVVIGAITGPPGVGKTALAIHWAHLIAPRFPDGQLYVDLRGFDPGGAVLPAHEAIRCFLNALGVPSERLPAEFAAQVGMYRSLLAHRRVLVVLDNARDAEQVRPLLPGTDSCLAVVTSRGQLSGLAASDGGRLFRLDTLCAGEALELLAVRLGSERVLAEPEAARTIAELCGHLPLALAIVGARAATYPDTPLASFVRELRESHGSLDAFESDDPAIDVRSVFSWSYRTLSPAAARMFQLLALSPAPEISRAAATALSGLDRRGARLALAELACAQLWREPVPGRFATHDLIRAYGKELALTEDSAAERAEARRRLLDHYLHSAHAADALLMPNRERITPPRAADGASPLSFSDPEEARSWLITELPVLLAIVEGDEHEGNGAYAWRIAAVLEQFLDRLGRRQDQLHVQRRALAAAERLGDLVGQAHCHRALGFALGRVEQHEEAEIHLLRARELYATTGDQRGEARSCRFLAFLANMRKEHRAALELYAHAVDLCERAGHREGSAALANDVGWTRILLGEHDEALRDCETAVRIAREVGDRNVEAAAWDSIGVAHHHLGRYDEALEAYDRALSQYRELGDAYLTADTLIHIGDTHQAADDTGPARTAWREALTILEDLAHPDAESVRTRLERTPTRVTG